MQPKLRFQKHKKRNYKKKNDFVTNKKTSIQNIVTNDIDIEKSPQELEKELI